MFKNRWLYGFRFIDKLTCFVEGDGGDAGGSGGDAPAGGGGTIVGGDGGQQQQQQQNNGDGGGDGGEKKPDGQQQQQQQQQKPAEPAKPEIGKDPNKTAEQNAADVAAEQAQLLEQAKGYEIKVPDGYQADPALRAKFDPIVAKHRLSKDAAQDLVNFEAEIRNDTIKEHWTRVKEWQGQTEKDPEIGGSNFEASKAHITAAVQQFGDPEFNKLMNDTGYGNHPALARFAARVGKAMGEGRAIPNGGKPGGKSPSAEDVFYGS